MVGFSLGGADGRRGRGAGSIGLPLALEHVVVQTLLRQEALVRVQKQQILKRQAHRDRIFV